MGILSAITKALEGKKTAVRLDDPPAAGSARDAVSSLSSKLREALSIEVRSAVDVYLEAMLPRDALQAGCRILEAALGPPAKPFGAKASFEGEVQALVDSRGGIQKSQALYLRRYEDDRIAFAALWPWSDGRWITEAEARENNPEFFHGR